MGVSATRESGKVRSIWGGKAMLTGVGGKCEIMNEQMT